MALPVSPDITLNPADPVPSALLNKLQACVVAGAHKEEERPFGPSDLQLETAGTATLSIGYWNIGSAGGLQGRIDARVGERVNKVRFEYNRGGAGAIGLFVYKSVAGVVTQLATSLIAAGTGVTTSDLVVNYQVEPGAKVLARFEPSNTANEVWGGAAFVDCLI